MRRCLSCEYFIRENNTDFITVETDKHGSVYCSKQDKVIDSHGRYSLKEWLSTPDLENDCKHYSLLKEDKSSLPVIRLSKEAGTGIVKVKFPSGSVYEYYGIEPPAYRKIDYVLHKKSIPQNAKASIILKKLKAGERAGNYQVTKISENNMDRIDKVVNKLLSEKDYGWDLDPDNEVEPDFEKADKKVHKVEDQWHYPILTKYGYKPLDKTGVGFVRSYRYKNPEGHEIVCVTGSSADYWEDKKNKIVGYHDELETHLKSMKENNNV